MKQKHATQILNRKNTRPAGHQRPAHLSANTLGTQQIHIEQAPRFFLKNKWTIFLGLIIYSSTTEQLML